MSRLPTRLSSALRTWANDPHLLTDAMFAILIGVVSLVEASSPDSTAAAGPDTFAYVTIVIGATSLLFRRHLPFTVMAIVAGIVATFYLRDGGDFLSALGLSPFYAVAAHSQQRRRAGIVLPIAGVGLFIVASVSILDQPDGYNIDGAASMVSSILAVTVAGLFVHNRQRDFADTEQRALTAEADKRAGAERAVAQERGRIAREMHDVVAHGMSVIAVQAAAAKEIVHTDPDKATVVLDRIESVGRESLNEMRRMLGVLRNGDDHAAASLAPQPGLTDVDSLIAQSTNAGVATNVTVTGQPRPVPPGIGLTAFRIAQEALTNVLKHAGQSASATVAITYEADTVTVEVTDDGRGAVSSLAQAGGGNGLIGMRERVEIYGGELSAGPRVGGGYVLRAVLPTDDAERRPSVASTTTTPSTPLPTRG